VVIAVVSKQQQQYSKHVQSRSIFLGWHINKIEEKTVWYDEICEIWTKVYVATTNLQILFGLVHTYLPMHLSQGALS